MFARTQSRLVEIFFSSGTRTTLFAAKRHSVSPKSSKCNISISNGQLFMWSGANNDQIWLPMILSNVQTDSQLDLISLLVNFSCELGQITIRYDFLWSIRVILSNVQSSNRLELDLISLLVNFSREFGQIIWLPIAKLWPDMTFYGLDEWFWAIFELTPTCPNFTFGQLCMWIGQIMTRYDFLLARRVILSNVQANSNFA